MNNSFPLHDRLQEQRRALAEETVSYAIYLSPSDQDQDQDQDHHEPMVTLESAQLAKTLIGSIVMELAKDYIWHKDAFSLRVESGKGIFPSRQPYLKGEARIGDSLDDEWLIVHLLREITERIPGSVARVQDNDGEFLLIEAADHIPSWLDPDNSDNRVFIYEGNLHIIPIAVTAKEKETFPPTLGSKSKSPNLQDALDIIRSSPSSRTSSSTVTTLANPKIQRAAFGPLISDTQGQAFASRKIQDQRHYARCQIPVDVARILKARPELVTRACEAFYTRDAIAMAACSRMTKFFPADASSADVSTIPGMQRLGKMGTSFVTTAVCFTKTCYAQLMGQQFRPPKIWDGIVPPPKDEDANDPQKIKEAELGMKLTCGFEILCDPDYPGDFGFKDEAELKLKDFSFATDNAWRIFKNNLTARKYFGDECPGSKGYQKLEEAAKQQFLEYKANQLRNEKDTEALSLVSFHGHAYHPVQGIERILDADLQSSEAAILVDDRKDDNDSWMEVDLETLEDMMRERGFGGGSSRDQNQANKKGLDMQQMIDRFGEFIQEGEGGIEGAEFMDEQSEQEDDEDEEFTEASHDRGENERGADNQSDEVSSEDDEEEDIFASDYEEQQAKKYAAKKARIFGNGKIIMNLGAVPDSTTTKATETTRETFTIDNESLKTILIQTFSDHVAPARTKGEAQDEREYSNEDEDMDDEGLQEYMEALDVELAGTKIGKSFEKMPAGPSAGTGSASSSVSTAGPTKEEKGKGVLRPTKAAKPEKNLEELMKEYTDRSRRGFCRHGPFGYDPAAMVFADDDDDDDDDDEEVRDDVGPDSARITEIMEDEQELDVVDVDLNLAKNLLESFKSQGGLPGPGGNLLSRLGIVLPRDEEEQEGDDV
ncbi:SGT1 protein-domain-containing protein [Gamsiella multidivaricata]|uniref:SGT1 protein-domain-containing protein n=1 Tax=Gamsiella multidivaricata TaxID=101098 RepID=UPI00221E9567|nr:SGT1 protein-domain-containing protein [Gamsiella multidivaricata]KAG0367732.1 hypothetical protein BGZ54_003376 [Gamsiella multidivaricata]KAI7832486.1 SGT1 protein-domain-containing protein [Gamsiella multidivaricata]